jgi:hypothetical protein
MDYTGSVRNFFTLGAGVQAGFKDKLNHVLTEGPGPSLARLKKRKDAFIQSDWWKDALVKAHIGFLAITFVAVLIDKSKIGALGFVGLSITSLGLYFKVLKKVERSDRQGSVGGNSSNSGLMRDRSSMIKAPKPFIEKTDPLSASNAIDIVTDLDHLLINNPTILNLSTYQMGFSPVDIWNQELLDMEIDVQTLFSAYSPDKCFYEKATQSINRTIPKFSETLLSKAHADKYRMAIRGQRDRYNHQFPTQQPSEEEKNEFKTKLEMELKTFTIGKDSLIRLFAESTVLSFLQKADYVKEIHLGGFSTVTIIEEMMKKKNLTRLALQIEGVSETFPFVALSQTLEELYIEVSHDRKPLKLSFADIKAINASSINKLGLSGFEIDRGEKEKLQETFKISEDNSTLFIRKT